MLNLAPMFGLLIALLVVALVTAFRRWKAARLAAELGLEARWTGSLAGRRDGFRVEYGPRTVKRVVRAPGDPGAQTTAYLEVPLPGDVRIVHSNLRGLGRPVDPDQPAPRRVSGDPHHVEALFEGGAVSGALGAVIAKYGWFHVVGRRVRTVEPGPVFGDVEGRIDRALALARALNERCLAPWTAVAERHGLDIEAGGGTRRLHGEVRGVSLSVVQDDGGLTVRAPLLGGLLPLRSRLVHVDHGSGNGVSLADPVLAGVVHATTSDPDALDVVLARPQVREALLEVVHGYPGSSLSDDAVELVGGQAFDPGPPVEAVVRLVRVLVDGA